MLGENMKRIRKKRRLNQTQVARSVGCSQSLISKIENGGQGIKAEMLSRLSELYGVPVQKFFE